MRFIMKAKITIRLYLQYPKIRKKISPVLMSVSWNGERVFKSTGVSVFPDEWDKKKEDVKNSAENAQAISLYLTLIKKEISEYHFDHLRLGALISKNDMRAKMDSVIQNAKYSGGNRKGFFDYYEEYLNIREKNNKYKPKTHENHRMIFQVIIYIVFGVTQTIQQKPQLLCSRHFYTMLSNMIGLRTANLQASAYRLRTQG
jgi:hypothetical protein